MPGQKRWLPAIFLVTFGAAAAHAAERSQFICSSGDLVRRVIVEVGDISTGLPCEVVYWKDKEAPGVRRVLWNARSDSAYCDGKAAGLVDKLTSAGWRCDQSGEAVQANVTPAPAAQASETRAVTPAPAPSAAAPSTTVPALDAATVATSETTAPQPAPLSDARQTTAALDTTVQPAASPATSNAPTASTDGLSSGGTTTTPDLQTAAVAPEAATAPALTDRLQSVVETNLASLNQSVDGDFQAKIGQFGDLNSDGIEDAVVLFDYQSSTADFTQFVAAYLFNGEDYHLAATKPVGGTDLAVRKVEVESISDGSIRLRLLLNDSSQTEDRRAAIILRDGQLVETE